MTYSEMQNVAVDGAERHQVEVKTGLAKMYAEGRGIFRSNGGEEEFPFNRELDMIPFDLEDGAL